MNFNYLIVIEIISFKFIYFCVSILSVWNFYPYLFFFIRYLIFWIQIKEDISHKNTLYSVPKKKLSFKKINQYDKLLNLKILKLNVLINIIVFFLFCKLDILMGTITKTNNHSSLVGQKCTANSL
jgi:hypothetical protein